MFPKSFRLVCLHFHNPLVKQICFHLNIINVYVKLISSYPTFFDVLVKSIWIIINTLNLVL